MMIVLPLGLLATAATCDVISAARRDRRLARGAYYMHSAGLLTGLGAAVPGAIDWWDIPQNTRAKKIGLLHGVGNLVVTGLFGANWLLRRRRPARITRKGLALSTSGALLALMTGWLGGELVNRLGVGVHENANVNAPSSLSDGGSRKPSRSVASKSSGSQQRSSQSDESITQREAI
jgi:uncharacterized membrane protein